MKVKVSPKALLVFIQVSCDLDPRVSDSVEVCETPLPVSFTDEL